MCCPHWRATRHLLWALYGKSRFNITRHCRQHLNMTKGVVIRSKYTNWSPWVRASYGVSFVRSLATSDREMSKVYYSQRRNIERALFWHIMACLRQRSIHQYLSHEMIIASFNTYGLSTSGLWQFQFSDGLWVTVLSMASLTGLMSQSIAYWFLFGATMRYIY